MRAHVDRMAVGGAGSCVAGNAGGWLRQCDWRGRVRDGRVRRGKRSTVRPPVRRATWPAPRGSERTGRQVAGAASAGAYAVHTEVCSAHGRCSERALITLRTSSCGGGDGRSEASASVSWRRVQAARSRHTRIHPSLDHNQTTRATGLSSTAQHGITSITAFCPLLPYERTPDRPGCHDPVSPHVLAQAP